MMGVFGILLDLVLIGLLGAGIYYAMKLTRQLADMRASRAEMERFVVSFNASVMRAEAGIQGLKNVARSSGDDLEKLIDKGQSLRDELLFLTESADQIATRISSAASKAHQTARPVAAETSAAFDAAGAQDKVVPVKKQDKPSLGKPSSAAEQDLMRALKGLG